VLLLACQHGTVWGNGHVRHLRESRVGTCAAGPLHLPAGGLSKVLDGGFGLHDGVAIDFYLRGIAHGLEIGKNVFGARDRTASGATYYRSAVPKRGGGEIWERVAMTMGRACGC
jgi:hypothetical protein